MPCQSFERENLEKNSKLAAHDAPVIPSEAEDPPPRSCTGISRDSSTPVAVATFVHKDLAFD